MMHFSAASLSADEKDESTRDERASMFCVIRSGADHFGSREGATRARVSGRQNVARAR
jgi:hypothetical protein